jgi:hypothetical protein
MPRSYLTMNQTSTLQTAIEAVEALSPEDQDFLFDLIHKRRHPQPSQKVLQRRQEILKNGIAARAAAKNGTAQRGTAAELMADLLSDEAD